MEQIKRIEALRDFFYVGTQDALKASYGVLELSQSATSIDWDQEEFLFNRLFVGPATPIAPAVASVYLDPEGQIQGRITQQVREFYENIGVSLPEMGREPEDSLVYELDACRVLLLLNEKIEEAGDVYQGFIDEHLAEWLPEFIEKSLAHCADSVAVKNVLENLLDWIVTESEKTILSKELS